MADAGLPPGAAALVVMLLLCGLSAPARAGEPVVTQVQCSFDYAPPQPCEMRGSVRADGSHEITFESAAASARFVGTSQSGWWSGELDGKPAMGYERNRGRVAFSTTDLARSFEWWSEGNEHGRY